MKLKKYLRRSILNNITNLLLQVRSFMLAKLTTVNGKATPPKDYELVFEDKFDSNSLSSEWRHGQPWGFFHTKQLYWYWSEKAVVPTKDGLVLENKHLPLTVFKKDLPWWQKQKSFSGDISHFEPLYGNRRPSRAKQAPTSLPDEFILPWASGLISSKRTFKFGWIEAMIKLPKEEMQWSAFWTSGSQSWPPEIDIFEAYTDQDVEAIKVQPNVHFRTRTNIQTGISDYGAPSISVKDPADRFVQYAVHWTEDFIKFYYDGVLVQVCNTPEILKDNAAPQYIIINNGLKQPTKEHSPTEGKMLVKDLKVFQRKDSTVK